MRCHRIYQFRCSLNESPESHISIQIFSTQDKDAHRMEKPSRQVSMASEGQTERLRASDEDMGVGSFLLLPLLSWQVSTKTFSTLRIQAVTVACVGVCPGKARGQ